MHVCPSVSAYFVSSKNVRTIFINRLKQLSFKEIQEEMVFIQSKLSDRRKLTGPLHVKGDKREGGGIFTLSNTFKLTFSLVWRTQTCT